MLKLSAMILLAVSTASVVNRSAVDQEMREQPRSSSVGSSFPTPLETLLDLPTPPPVNAYAITGNLLPPFFQAVLSAWQREFPKIPLSANGIIFVIRPADFYADLNPEQKNWLTSREMLSIQNFPLIINPLTPGDDWYLQAQQEWKRGNDDAIYILLTSLFHEITHMQRGADESAAYKNQLALFDRFRKAGRLASPYAQACHKALRDRRADLLKHPDQYVQVYVHFQNRTTALLVYSPKTSRAPVP